MAIDLSNIGPGGAAASDVARKRRERLAAAKKPLIGPGAAGLGTPMPKNTFIPKDNTPFAEKAFRNIDTMLFRDRLAPARAFLESKGSAFNLKQNDITGMIRAGFLTYGKGGAMKYPGLTASASPQALNELLRTNYTQRGNKWIRTNKNLKVTPNTASYLAYGGLSSDTDAAIEKIGQGKVVRSARSPALDYKGMPLFGDAKDAGIDYAEMADDYAKDKEQENTWNSKIASKVQKEGGAALWNKVMSGKYTPADVQNLRKYMYSPNGEYGSAQEKFIQETLLKNNDSSPAELLKQRSLDTYSNLVAENDKAAVKAQETLGKDIQAFLDMHFDPKKGATPDSEFDAIVNAINNANGGIITNGMIDRVMRDGAGSYVEDSSVTGGKRFVPAPLRGFTEAQKASLIDAVVNAQDNGYTIPGGIRPYLDDTLNDLIKSGEDKPINTDMLANIAVINPTLALGMGVTALAGKSDVGQATISAMEKATNSSFLQPTQNPNAGEWLLNWDKGLARAGTGLMPGIYYLATDPASTTKAIATDYWNTYTNWDNFKARVANDPLAPAMDVLSLVDGIGLVLKGGQIVSATGRLAKAGEVAADAGRFEGPLQPGQEYKVFDPEYNPAINADVAKVGDEVPATGVGISRTDYAALMRKVAIGDETAKMTLENLLPRGSNGSNSLTMPTFMDRAAGLFEPRWKFITSSDGNKVVVDQARQAALQDVTEGAYIRFSGNPLIRARQRALFTAQARGGKASGMIANMPLLGFNYRFEKAARESSLTVNEAVRREMAMTNLHHKAIDDMKLQDHEQQVVMDSVAGGTYSPAVYASIIRKRLVEEAKGMTADTKQFLQAQLDLFENPEYLKKYADAYADMIEAKSPRGIELAKARNSMLMLQAKQNRLVSAFDSPAAIQTALTAYQPLTSAAHLTPKDLVSELGSNADNLVMFNPNWHFAEQIKVHPENFVMEDGVARPVTPKDTPNADLLKQMEQDMEYMRQDHSFRNLGGHPFFIVDEVIKDAEGAPLLVRGRRLRLDGSRLEDYSLERSPLIDQRSLLVPASAVMQGKKGIVTFSREQAIGQLHIGAVNALNKLFPNVRDFVDKISPTSVNGRESFKQMENRGIVTESGMQSYHLEIQFKAHKAYLQKRVAEDWQHFFDTTAIPIRVGDFNSNNYVATKTAKLFEDRAAAEAYAANYDSVGAIEKGNVSEVTVGDKTMYKTSLRYFDVVKNTVLEQKKKNFKATEQYEKDYLASLDSIKFLDDNEIIMAVPKPVYDKFRASQASVDANVRDIVAPRTKKALRLYSSIFKVLALPTNPHFVPQSVVGSTTMVGLATPELLPRTMAGLFQYGAKKAARGIGRAKETPGVFKESRAKGESVKQSLRDASDKLTTAESQVWSNHIGDFDYMTRTMPHQFDNAYHSDAVDSFSGKLGDSRLAKYTIYNGYTVVFAFESNMRISLMREIALKYPGFKSLMKSGLAKQRAAEGIPDLGLEKMSPFQATFEMLRDPNSPLHDPNFVNEVTHTADGVLGNYRDFSETEKAIRNYIIPFYAWQRHSALFTKRLFEERPLAANAAYNLGNYGFERTLSAGGVPDWLYESVPMPDALQNILDMNPMNNNRLNFAPINPMGTFTEATTAGISALAGPGALKSTTNLFDYTNPFINNIIAQQQGIDPRTGYALSPDEKNKGIFERTFDTLQGFPAISLIANTFKSYDDLNARRGMDNPGDIFQDASDPNSKLKIPKDKLTVAAPTLSKQGVFNSVMPIRAVSLDPEAMAANYKKQLTQQGIKLPSNLEGKTALEKNIASLMNWKKKAEFVKQYYMPAWGDQPEWTTRVQTALAKEFPTLPKNFPPELYNQIMGGAG